MIVRVLVVVLALMLAGEAWAARPWAWLGVRIRDLSEAETDEISKRHGIREGFGVVIVDVLAESPASRAGLKGGDIVVAFEGRPVTETRLLQRLIAGAPPEREVKLVVLRQEGRQPVPVRLATMPRDVAGDRVAALFGFALREPPPVEGTSQPSGGSAVPFVAAVERGASAEKGGLRLGDVILQVGERPTVSREAAREALADATPEQPLRIIVRRNGDRVALTLPVAQPPVDDE